MKKRSRRDFVKKAKTYGSAFIRIGMLFSYIRIAYMEWLYATHLKIRHLHDNTYEKVNWYKNWSDKKYSSGIHKATFVAFVMTFVLSFTLQNIFPGLFTKPKNVFAGAHSVTWTTKGDFENNDVTVDSETTITDAEVSGTDSGDDADVTLSLTNSYTWPETVPPSILAGRFDHTVVWTGSKMIVWGGHTNGGLVNDGGLYAPSTNAWTSVSTTNAPSARERHTAIWTGSKMIVWGGNTGGGLVNDGGLYDPDTDTWTSVSTTNAPSARNYHTAIWTGSKMIVWGGVDSGGILNNGGLYDPDTDTWTAVTTTNAPAIRYGHTAIWTGSKMIVWGGTDDEAIIYNDGGLYDPVTDTWAEVTVSGSPSGRTFHTVIWTGSKMIVWGGIGDSGYLNSGGQFNPSANIWTSLSTIDAPSARINHTAVWTEEEMYVWGGSNELGQINTGGLYNPNTDSWVASPTVNAPSDRTFHTAIWTGFRMVVWGGVNSGPLDDGGRSRKTYETAGTITNLKIDSGADVKSDWSQISWNNEELLEGTEIKFRTRGADSENDLPGATWSAYYTVSGSSITTNPSQWLEVELTLISDGIDTPVLNDFTIDYDSVDVPTTLTQTYSDGSTPVPTGGWYSKTVGGVNDWIYLYSTITCLADQDCHTEYEFKNASESFDGTDLVIGESILAGQTGESWIVGDINNPQTDLLSEGNYIWRVRVVDDGGRVSPWAEFNNGDTAFKIDHTSPSGTIKIENGASVTKAATVHITSSVADGSGSGVSMMRFSNDNENWSEWESYAAYKIWDTSAGNGLKTVYGQFKDSSGNVGTASDEITVDGTGPSIVFNPDNKYPNANWNVKENINGVEIRFTTNRSTFGYVDYGISNANEEASGDPIMRTSHSILVKPLQANTAYRYRIRAIDSLENVNTLPVNADSVFTEYYSFHTTSADTGFDGRPFASNMSQVEITASTAKITWKTVVPTSSWVDFGLDTDYGSTAGDETLSTTHVVELKNLIAGKTYHYRVRGIDATDNEFSSSDFTFKAVMKPEIGDIKVSNVTPYTAEVSWTTNVKTDSDVAYGETTSYSNREKDAGFLTSHRVILKDLTDQMKYHFQIEARDEYGNATKSPDNVFETPLDTAGPIIEDVRIDIVPVESDENMAQVIMSWKTDKPSTAKVEYGEGIVGGMYEKSSWEDTTLNLSHTVIIKELNPGRSYHFRIVTKDKRENKTESSDYTIVTPAKQKSIWQLILQALEETFAWVSQAGQYFVSLKDKI